MLLFFSLADDFICLTYDTGRCLIFTRELLGSVTENLVKATAAEGLVFKGVEGGGLKGGYFISPALPYIPADYYFNCKASGILVMMSGLFYNKNELSGIMDTDVRMTDPELVSLLFDRYGPHFAEKLNGDFVIYIELQGSKDAYLYRDHAGIRPMEHTHLSPGASFFLQTASG